MRGKRGNRKQRGCRSSAARPTRPTPSDGADTQARPETDLRDRAPVRILLAEPRPGEARLCVRELCLLEPRFRVTSASTLTEMLAVVSERKPDLLVLDLALPDGEGLEGLRRVQALVPGVPVVVLASTAEKELAQRALKTGASDYLLKEHIDHHNLLRALQCVLWRGQEAVLAPSGGPMDELTGLYHRDAFLRMAARHFEQARKLDCILALLRVDVDGLDEINRVHGRAEGDRVLIDAVELLRNCFRRTDLLGRTGENEFAVLAIDAAGPSGPILRQRLERRLVVLNEPASRPYRISLSIGVHLCNPARGGSLQDLLLAAEADLRTINAAQVPRRPFLADSSRENSASKGESP